jgi:hypothetical protein
LTTSSIIAHQGKLLQDIHCYKIPGAKERASQF